MIRSQLRLPHRISLLLSRAQCSLRRLAFAALPLLYGLGILPLANRAQAEVVITTPPTYSSLSFTNSGGIAVDAQGNVYYSDGSRIRSASLSIDTSPVDFVGASYPLSSPRAVTLGPHGDLFFINGSQICRLSPGGAAATIAGVANSYQHRDGPAATAMFYNPDALAITTDGTIYIAEAGSHVVSRISPDGFVSVLAGQVGSSGTADGAGNAARFTYPRALAVDGSGNAVVVDGTLVRRITPTGIVTTLAGSSYGLVDGAGSVAKFQNPVAIEYGPDGNYYVADSNTLRCVTPAGVVTTVAGSFAGGAARDGVGTAARLIGPYTMGHGVDGAIYWGGSDYKLRRIALPGAGVPQAPFAYSSPAATSILVGESTALQTAIASYPTPTYQWYKDGSALIGRTEPTLPVEGASATDSGYYTLVASNALGTATSAPIHLRVLTVAAGDAFAGAPAIGALPTIVAADFIATTREAGEPATQFGAGGGTLWWTWTAPSSGFVRFDATGSEVPVGLRIYTGADLASLTEVPIAPAYVPTARVDRRVVQVTAGVTYRIVVEAANASARGEAHVHVAYTQIVSLLAGDPITGYGTTDGSGSAAKFAYPTAIARDPSGNLYLAEGNHLRKITPAGVVTTIGSGAFTSTADLVADASGNLYVTDASAQVIRKVTPAGVVSVFAGAVGVSGITDGTGTNAQFYSPGPIAIDANGNLYVGDVNAQTLRKITPGAVVTTIAGSPYYYGSTDGTGANARFAGFTGMAVQGSTLWVLENYSNTRRLRQVDLATFAVTTPVSDLSPWIATPVALAASGAGDVYLAGDKAIVRRDAYGTITPVAGNGTQTSSNTVVYGDGLQSILPTTYGLAADAGGNFWFVTSTAVWQARATNQSVAPLLVGVQSDGTAAATGSSFTFTALAFGGPTVTYQWYRDATPVGTGPVLTLASVAPADAGTYTVTVTSGGASATSAGVAFSVLAPAANDNWASAAVIAGDALAVTGDNHGATTESGEAPVAADAAGRSVWWTWTAPRDGTVLIDAAASRIPVRLAVRQGATVDTLSTLAASATGKLSLTVAAGQTYAIVLDGVAGATGTMGSLRLAIHYQWAVQTIGGTPNLYGYASGSLADALFFQPSGIVRDSSGNAFIADARNDVIRKVTPDGTVSTFVGSPGLSGYADGTGTAAQFSNLKGLAIDSANNLYALESNRVRKITPGGVVTLLAGDPSYNTGYTDATGVLARFNYASGIAVGSDGYLYIADTNNRRIRRVDPTSGAVTTVAGSSSSTVIDGIGTAASFSNPRALVAGAPGELFVVEGGALLIRRIQLSSYAVTTIAGAGVGGVQDGPALEARFSSPNALGYTAGGQLVIADGASGCLRVLWSDGYVSTVAGPTTPDALTHQDGVGPAVRFSGVAGMCPDGQGGMLLIESGGHIVRRLITGAAPLPPRLLSQPADTTVAAGAPLTLSVGVVAQPGGTYVWRQDGSVLPGETGATLTRAQAAAGDSGTYTVTVTNTGGTATTTPFTVSVVGPPPNDAFANAAALTALPTVLDTHNLLATAEPGEPVHVESSGHSVWWRWTADSDTTVLVSVTADSFQPLTAVYTGSSVGALTLVASSGTNAGGGNASFTQFDTTAGTTYYIAVDGRYGATGPMHVEFRRNSQVSIIASNYVNRLAVDSAGNVYTADTALRRYSPAGDMTVLNASVTNSAIAIASDGTLYLADISSQVIRRVATDGTATIIAGTTGLSGYADGVGTAARFSAPSGLALDPTGTFLVVADTNNHVLRKVDLASGTVTTLAGYQAGLSSKSDGAGPSARLLYPGDIQLAPNGHFLIPDGGSFGGYYGSTFYAYLRDANSEGGVSTLAGSGSWGFADGVGDRARFSSSLGGIGIDAAGNAWVADGSYLRRVSPDGLVTTVAAGLGAITDVAVAPDGTVYVATSNGLGKLVPDTTGAIPAVATLPTITQQPVSTSVYAGQVALFYVGATSNVPGATYAWTHDGTPVAGADGPLLRIDNTSAADAGNYQVIVTNSAGDSLSSIVTLTVSDRPANDLWANAVTAMGATAAMTGNNTGASVEAGEPVPPGVDATIWWRWTAPATGAATLDSAGTAFDPTVLVYRGDSLANLTLVGSATQAGPTATNANPRRPTVTFDAEEGVTYYFAVGGIPGFTGDVALHAYFTYTFTTLAGLGGTSGNADGTGTAARFYQPNATTVGPDGTVYVADLWNHTVRKITTDGVVTTLAGSAGNSGYVNSTGSSARFYFPAGITWAPDGYLYVADASNHAIRRVNPISGAVTTFAGPTSATSGTADGTTTAARFNYPVAIVTDAAGTFYVAEAGNHAIRKITAAGVVSTFAGQKGTSGSADGVGTAAQFYDPEALAVDSAGNVFVADYRNHTIRRIAPNATVTTIAGAAGLYAFADGPATTTGRLTGPDGVLALADGTLLIADRGNNALRMLTTDGYLLTLAGSPDGAGYADGIGAQVKFSGPASIATDGHGLIYIADQNNHAIRRGRLSSAPAAPEISLQPQGGRILYNASITLTASAVGNPKPTYQWYRDDVPIDGAISGTLVVPALSITSSANFRFVATNTIGSTSSQTATVQVLPPPPNDAFGSAITILGAANVVDAYNYTATAQSGESDHDGDPAVASVWFTWTAPANGDVTIDTLGSTLANRLAVYVGDTLGTLTAIASDRSPGKAFARVRFAAQAGTVYRIAVDGVSGATGEFRLTVGYSWNFIRRAGAFAEYGSIDGSADAARFNFPGAFAADPSGNLYIADTNNCTVRKVAPDGTVTTLAGSAGAAGTANGTGSAARFNRPFGLAIGPDGNLYVADTNNHAIRKVTPAGAVTTFAGSPGTSGYVDGTGTAARFANPVGIAFDTAGNAYVTDYSNNLIRKITPAGVVTTFAGAYHTVGNSAKYFNTPNGIAVDAAGNVYVADTAALIKLTPDGTASLFAGDLSGTTGSADGVGNSARFNHPAQIAFDHSGNLLVADHDNQTIRSVTSKGEVRTIGGDPANRGYRDGTAEIAAFTDPTALAVDAGGYLYVGDGGGYLVRLGAKQIASRAPMITSQPVDLAVPAGTPATFVVIAAGEPAPAYQWRKNGTPIPNATSPILTLASVSAGDAASYDVVITNSLGTATSRAATLSLAAAPANDSFATAASISASVYGVTGYLTAATAETGEPDHAGSAATSSVWWTWTAPANGAVVAETTGSSVPARLAVYTGSSLAALTPVVADAASQALGSSRVQFDAVAGATYHLAVDRAGPGSGPMRLNLNYALVVSTLAGNAAASGSTDGLGAAALLSGPYGLARDSSGNVYVADSVNDTIRKITPQGVTTTFAGSPGLAGSADGTGAAARFNQPTGVTVDLLDRVIVADSGNHTIRRITPDGVVTTIGGAAGVAGSTDGTATQSRFNTPIGVAAGPVVNGGGTVYVADYGNHTIRRITTAGQVSTVAGTAGLSGYADGTGTAARFNGPVGIATDASENLYVTDFNNHTVRRISLAGEVTTLAGFPGSAGTTNGPAGQARFWAPQGIAVDFSTGRILVTQLGNNSLRAISPDGVVTTLAGGTNAGHQDGTGLAAGFDHPIGVATGPNGAAFVNDYQSNTVRRLTPADQVAVAQTITFAALADTTYPGNPIALSATASSGLEVVFELVSGPATLSGTMLTLMGTGTVTVRATQPGNASYLAAIPVERSFNVTAAATSFAGWQQSVFTNQEVGVTAISGPTADPDHDGLTNLLEYALGLDPMHADPSGRPTVTSDAANWSFNFTRPSDRPDLSYAVEISTDLVHWSTANVALTKTGTASGTETWQATTPHSTGSTVFFRLRIDQQ